QNYLVKAVPVLTITNTNRDLSVVTGIDGYSVRYFLDGDYGTIVDESTTGNYAAAVDGIYTAKAVNYLYNATVLSTCISPVPSNGISIIATGISTARDVLVSVYPNPMINTLNLSTAITDELSYELYDRKGIMLRKAPFQQEERINVEELKAGVYVLVIKKENKKLGTYTLVK
ncbi:MAG: T9SS type A sorting domain-containing protein, partial [Cytophagaceae bacterium]|nr:T9SS type A sorting domain-containing protein [Cytophagaceae bacterium]